MTGTSGMALIALPGDLAYVGGSRGETRWPGVGVLAADGWIFYEDKRPE